MKLTWWWIDSNQECSGDSYSYYSKKYHYQEMEPPFREEEAESVNT